MEKFLIKQLERLGTGHLLYIYSEENYIVEDDNEDPVEDDNKDPVDNKYTEEALIAYYDAINNVGNGTHNATSTEWKDLSGNGNDATLNNFDQSNESGWQDGNSIELDGINDWISVEAIRPNNTEENKKISNTAFSVETVVEYNSICEDSKSWEIISNRETGGFAIACTYSETETKNRISIYDNSNGYQEIKDSEPIRVNQKYHLLITYSQNKNVKFYINGNLIGTIEGVTYRNPTNNTILAIGANPEGNSINAQADYFKGKLYSVRVYNKELSQDEINKNYNYEEKRYNIEELKIENYIDDGLRVYYDSINNTGKNTHSNTTTTWKDLSNHGNDGTLNQFTSNSGWQENNGLVFDGTDDWVSIRKLNYDKLTLEAVVEYNQLPKKSGDYMCVLANVQAGGAEICNKYTNDEAYNGAMIKIQEEGNYVSNYSDTATELNKKYYISVTYDGEKIKLFENGNMYEVNQNGTIQFPENNTIWALGTNPDGANAAGNYLNGKIYSIRIYNRSLTEEEIINNYSLDNTKYSISDTEGNTPYASNGLTVYYDAKNNTGEGDTNHSTNTTIWKDLSNHGNDGKLTNFNNTTTSGWQNNYLAFDGSNDWVAIGQKNYEKITMEVVVEYDLITNNEQDIICNFQSGGLGICGVNSKNKFAIYANSKYNWQNSANNAELGKKYHLVGTYDGSNMKFYQNGNLIQTTRTKCCLR